LSAEKNCQGQGVEVKKGEFVLKKGIAIHPGVIGILATLGKAQVKVFRKPKVVVLATGSELTRPGKPLGRGKIYDSNSWMMAAALKEMQLKPLSVQTLTDRPVKIKHAISEALKRADVLILMGGVSVGKYDFVKSTLKELGVKEIFWRVKQKPGKPLFFGQKKKTLVFGLPGNPASVFTCFYEYAYAALRRMSGFPSPELSSCEMELHDSLNSDPSKILFLKGKTLQNGHGRTAGPLRHQGSHMISSLRDAEGLLVVTPDAGKKKKGEMIRMDFFPYQVVRR